MIVLIKEIDEWVKGYGHLSDLSGNTYYGIPKTDLEKYEKVYSEFVEDENMPPYICPKDVPTCSIPKGKLKIYGELKE